jgi:hypothetical protein
MSRPISHRPLPPSAAALNKTLISLPSAPPLRFLAYPAPRDRSSTADAWFDPITAYPYFPLRPSQLQEHVDLKDAETDSDVPELYPHAFVPSTAQGNRPTVPIRPSSNQAQKKMAADLPVDLFDSPDMDLMPPDQYLRNVAVDGAAHALSRHYDTQVCSPLAWVCQILSGSTPLH